MAEPILERAPCPQCAEPILVSARVCPLCRRSALLDLAALEPIGDARKRYQIARRLVELGWTATVSELLKALEHGKPVARDLTIQQALWYRAAFEAVQCQALLTPVPVAPATAFSPASIPSSSPLFPSSSSWFRKLVLLGAAASALLIVGGVWRWRATHSVSRAAAAPQAQAAPQLEREKPEPLAFSPRSDVPTPQAVAHEAVPSVVVLTCRNKLGTGFFVQRNTLVTNLHVTCGGDPLDVQMVGGEKGQAFVTSRRSEQLDIAVLYTSLEGKPLPLATAGSLVAGDPAMVVGNPKGLESTFHVGNVSNPHRFYNGLNYLQVDARINPGNSGGPVLDARGNVVGVVSLGVRDAEGLGMALPIDYLWENGGALLPVQPGHPSPGFQVMLDKAKTEAEALAAKEAAREVLRLESATRSARGAVTLRIRLDTQQLPPSSLPFEFITLSGQRCRTDLNIAWRRFYDSDPRFEDPNAVWKKYVSMDTLAPCSLISPVVHVSLLRGDLRANSLDIR